MSIPVRTATLSAVAVLALAISGCTAAVVDPAALADSDRSLPTSQVVQDVVDDLLSAEGVPASVVLITSPDGDETLIEFGDRPADAPQLEDAVFAYRSITKSFVGTVILQLADEGIVKLDAPVSDYVAGVPGGDQVTLTDLANMRSGLPSYSASPALGPALLADPEAEPDVSSLLQMAFDEPNTFAPGESYEYSNTNTLLLGEVIAEVTGMPWDAAVADRLLHPLGLTSVSYGFANPELDQSGYQLQDGSVVEQLPRVAGGWFGASGAFTGNVRDLAEWGRALGVGATISSDSQKFRLSQLGTITDDPASPVYDNYGFAIGEIDGWVGHTGAGLGFQSLVMFDPQSELVVAILLNGTGEDQNLPARLFTMLLSAGSHDAPDGVTSANTRG